MAVLDHDLMGTPIWTNFTDAWKEWRFRGDTTFDFDEVTERDARSLLVAARVLAPDEVVMLQLAEGASRVPARTIMSIGTHSVTSTPQHLGETSAGAPAQLRYFQITEGNNARAAVMAYWPDIDTVVRATVANDRVEPTWTVVNGNDEAGHPVPISRRDFSLLCDQAGVDIPTDHELKILRFGVDSLDNDYRVALGVDIGSAVLPPRQLELLGARRYREIGEVPGAINVLASVQQASHRGAATYAVAACDPETERHLREYLEVINFFDRTGMPRDHLHVCREPAEKEMVVRDLSLTGYVDDRVDVLESLQGVVRARFLFDPDEIATPTLPPDTTITSVTTWAGVARRTPLPKLVITPLVSRPPLSVVRER